MANPVEYEEHSADLDVVTLHVKWTAGSSGAVGAIATQREFIAGSGAVVKQTAAGTYRLFLKETWFRLLNGRAGVIQGTFDATHGFIGVISNDTSGSTSSPFVEIELRQISGAVANPASGDVISVTLEMQKTKP